MKNVDAAFAKSKYLEVSELGCWYNLSFSSQLVLRNKIIALDGIRKSLLVVENNTELTQPYVIDLNKVSAVTVRNTYGSINQGELKTKGIDEFLKKVDLQFQFKDNTETFVLPFYDHEIDDKRNRTRLGRNAKNWQMILSKMVEQKTKEKTKNETGSIVQLPLVTST